MNEKIKELAIAAKLEHCVSHVRLQDFAERIIKECAEIVKVQNEQFMQNESHYGVVSADILNHFGIYNERKD